MARDIEGEYFPGEVGVVIDDVITSGGSVLTCIKQVKGAGLEIRDVVVLLDREQGGRESLQAAGYAFHACLKFHGVLKFLREQRMITQQQYESVTNSLG